MDNTFNLYLEDIRSLTFSRSYASCCTIVLEDDSTVVFNNPNSTTNRDNNKVDSFIGAMEKVQKLCGAKKPLPVPTVPVMEMHDIIYQFIGATTFTVATLKQRLHNLKFNQLENVIQSFMPLIAAGRQTGHTTAIAKFIADNRHMSFGIMVDEDSFRRDYAKLKNAYSIRLSDVPRGYVDDRLRGITLDYLIIDKVISQGVDLPALDRVLSTCSNDDTKLVGLGN